MRDVLFDFHSFCCLTWNFSKFKIRIFFQHRPGWPVRSSCGCIWRMLWRYRGEAQVTNVTNHQTKQLWVGHFSANWSFRVFFSEKVQTFSKDFPESLDWTTNLSNHQLSPIWNWLIVGISPWYLWSRYYVVFSPLFGFEVFFLGAASITFVVYFQRSSVGWTFYWNRLQGTVRWFLWSQSFCKQRGVGLMGVVGVVGVVGRGSSQTNTELANYLVGKEPTFGAFMSGLSSV